MKKQESTVSEKVLNFLLAMSQVAKRLLAVIPEEKSVEYFITDYLQAYNAMVSKEHYCNTLRKEYLEIKKYADGLNRSYLYTTDYEKIELPTLFIFWETEAINRRVDKRYNYKNSISLTKWTMGCTLSAIYFDNILMGEIEQGIKVDNLPVFDFLQLHYFKNARKMNYTPEKNQEWKGILEEFTSRVPQSKVSKLSLYHQFLRQAKGYLDADWDQCQQCYPAFQVAA